MSFPKYPAYRPSAVIWLGEVPEHWQVLRLKHACEVFPSNVDKHARDDEYPIRLCNYTDVYYNERITADMPFMVVTASEEQVARFTLKSGDTIITKDSETADDIAIAAYVPEDLPGVVCGYHLSMVRPRGTTCGAFVKRLFDSIYAKAKFEVAANGLTRVGLGQYALDNVELPFPPSEEQRVIAAFLDRETAKIDALVEEQKRLIKLLKEKRQAVISQAVTKGLDPNVPMKNSGVEWLGMVPKHWEVVRLKRLVVFKRGHDLPADARSDGPIPVVSSGGFSGTHNVACASAPGIVTGRYGSIGQFVLVETDYWPLNTALYSIELFDNYVRYVWYVLQSIAEHFVSHSLKSAVPGVDRNDIHEIFVVKAPTAEQRDIARFLDYQTQQIDRLVSECELAMEVMAERRSALISAAVTGKIDVRGLAPQPEGAEA